MAGLVICFSLLSCIKEINLAILLILNELFSSFSP